MKKKIIFLFVIFVSLLFGKEEKLNFISEDNFSKTMTQTVEPFIKSIKTSGYFLGQNHKNIYYETFKVNNSKGSIVLIHGFTESIEKFYELIYYFTTEGYDVYALEHRGHSHSDKFTDKSEIYVDNYNYYIEDIKTFIDTVVPKSQNLYMFAHSMGGGIGTLFLERYPDYFQKAILNTPMLQINFGKTPNFVAKSYSRLGTLFGKGSALAIGETSFSGKYDFENASTSSKARYDYYYNKLQNNKNLQNGGASIKWINEALKITDEATKKSNIKKIKTRTLLFQAGNDHYVKASGQEKLTKNANITLIRISNSKHEIYRETDSILRPYLFTVLDFYNN